MPDEFQTKFERSDLEELNPRAIEDRDAADTRKATAEVADRSTEVASRVVTTAIDTVISIDTDNEEGQGT